MNAGKRIRMGRFRSRESRFGILVPIDHGLTLGPVEGLGNVNAIGRWIGHPAIDGIIAHKGMVERLAERGWLQGVGVMLHLNGMSSIAPTPDRKEMLTSVETAIRLGADGVSVQINFDGQNDAHNMQLLGSVVDKAQAYGLPVLTMLYDKVESRESAKRLERLRHLMRITVELGTDAIKIGAPSALAEVAPILDGIREDVAIYFAGGAKCSDEQLFALTREALEQGASGLCVGRNIFQRKEPSEVLAQLGALLRLSERTSAIERMPFGAESRFGVGLN